jgi:hypothetical protein
VNEAPTIDPAQAVIRSVLDGDAVQISAIMCDIGRGGRMPELSVTLPLAPPQRDRDMALRHFGEQARASARLA